MFILKTIKQINGVLSVRNVLVATNKNSNSFDLNKRKKKNKNKEKGVYWPPGPKGVILVTDQA
jgi:hypothetical protein